MAKRRRLGPAAITGAAPDTGMPADLETKAANGWAGVRARSPGRTTRAPIAEVSGEAAAQGAFEEVAGELRAARAEGRMVARLPLAAVEAAHLVRDRLAVDEDETAVLKTSLAERGQQTPVEVVDLGQGRYGLISGWRRLMALRDLQQETGDARFAHVQALIRSPADAAAAYRAMVEENEVRAGLSFYERARIAVKAAEEGVHPDPQAAVAALFSAARAPKRSKIVAFTALVGALDDVLRFPAAIPEKLGLALASALGSDEGARRRLREALRKADPQTAEAERKVLERMLGGQGGERNGAPAARRPPGPSPEKLAPGVILEAGRRRIVLSGTGVDEGFVEGLRAWVAARKS